MTQETGPSVSEVLMLFTALSGSVILLNPDDRMAVFGIVV